MPSKKRREIFASNLQRYIDISGKSRGSFCESIGITAASLSEWLNAKKYPRIDTIEEIANYFGIDMSDLIEDHYKPKKEWTDPNSPKGILIKSIEELSETEVNGFLALMNLFRNKK